MAGFRLVSRVDALEQKQGAPSLWPAAWIVAAKDESREQAIARHEAGHGTIGERMAIVWLPSGSEPCRA